MPDNVTPQEKWTAIIIIALILIVAIVGSFHDIISNNAIQFYRSAPHYLFYVLLCAIGIGLIAMLVARLIDNSKRVKHILKTIEIIFIAINIISIVLIVCCWLG